jgi:stress response protein YsnF
LLAETNVPTHDIDTVLRWRGSTVVDRDGDKVGTLEELYLDHADRPSWGAVHTGLFGMRQTFIPLTEATELGDQLQVPFDKDHVKSAPNIDPAEQLTDDQERELYRHYRLPAGETEAEEDPGAATARDDPAGQGRAAQADAATAARGNDDAARDEQTEDGGAERRHAEGDAPDAITRSEEELVVGKRRRVRGRARLKKYVVTDHVQKTVPVRREEVRVEYDPADDEQRGPER